ncbi:MAG: hypothetical protein KKH28_13605 [Elusimicrobia bacterium]|nr:hypothetical protein [Elusimicrobiota bacterium]
MFFMAVSPALFQGLADGWLGNLIGHTWLGIAGPVHPLYVAIALCVVLYSIGESFYSPRLYEYPAAIAPKGQEAPTWPFRCCPILSRNSSWAPFPAFCWCGTVRPRVRVIRR